MCRTLDTTHYKNYSVTEALICLVTVSHMHVLDSCCLRVHADSEDDIPLPVYRGTRSKAGVPMSTNGADENTPVARTVSKEPLAGVYAFAFEGFLVPYECFRVTSFQEDGRFTEKSACVHHLGPLGIVWFISVV